MALLLDGWGKCAGCGGDLDSSGAIDASDFTAMLEQWGPCLARSGGGHWEHEDGTITHEGRTYASWEEYAKSIDPATIRCGTRFEMLEGGVAAVATDCDFLRTIPRAEYEPASTLCITVVVHVLRQGPGLLGDIPSSRIFEQINQLNSAFAPARIRFQLATQDPSGQPSLGFYYHDNNAWYNDSGSYWNTIAWDTSRYLNIYTNTVASLPIPNPLGFATFPWSNQFATPEDRVVVNWRNFGIDLNAAPFGLGMTCVHEVGHYLGLLHTYDRLADVNGDGVADNIAADGCASGDCYATGDLCCDTGRTAVEQFGCESGNSTCGDGPDPIENVMSYSNDDCVQGFTREQIGRMRCNLMSVRTGLPGPCSVPGDLNGDGATNAQDLAALLAQWGNCDPGTVCAGDINGDGTVNAVDLSTLTGGWYAAPLPPRRAPSWATMIEADPDPAVVTNPTLREAIRATGLAWRVRDAATQIDMVLVPPGTFSRGCTPSIQFDCSPRELPVHTVVLTSPFYMGRYEVTQAQWQAVMGSNPSLFQGAADSPSRPVERVSWNAVQGFLAATTMRLPTDAEWEFACRAGTTTAFHGWPAQPAGTNDDMLIGSIAWFLGNNGPSGSPSFGTKPVGQKAPNGFGLYDMAGNVEEWCSDYSHYYTSASVTNPKGPATGINRMTRATGWGGLSLFARSSYRSFVNPGSIGEGIGFRVVRSP